MQMIPTEIRDTERGSLTSFSRQESHYENEMRCAIFLKNRLLEICLFVLFLLAGFFFAELYGHVDVINCVAFEAAN